MKRLRLYSDDSQQELESIALENLETAVEKISKDVKKFLEKNQADSLLDILEGQTETHQSKIKSEEIDYFSVSRQLKKKLISYYLNNKSRYHIYSNRRGRLSVDDYIRKVYLELGQKLYSIDIKGAAAKVSKERLPSDETLGRIFWVLVFLGFGALVVPDIKAIVADMKQSVLSFLEGMGDVLLRTFGPGASLWGFTKIIGSIFFHDKYTSLFQTISGPISAAIKHGDTSKLSDALAKYDKYLDPKPNIDENTEIEFEIIRENKSAYYVKLVYTFEDTMLMNKVGGQLMCILEVHPKEKGKTDVRIVYINPKPSKEPEVVLALLMLLAQKVEVQLSNSSAFNDSDVFLKYGILMNQYIRDVIQNADEELSRIRDILRSYRFYLL